MKPYFALLQSIGRICRWIVKNIILNLLQINIYIINVARKVYKLGKEYQMKYIQQYYISSDMMFTIVRAHLADSFCHNDKYKPRIY